MNIDWHAFTPWTSLSGGALIGLSAALFLLFNGRIAGISGILGGLLGDLLERPAEGTRPPATSDISWRVAFLFGLIGSSLIWQIGIPLPSIQIDSDYPTLIVAGIIVGISTRYGAGCTSGHGVCGLSRLSPRSLVATLCFMASGFVTVFIIRHAIGG